MMNDRDLKALENAHTGTDLETICWEAASEIKALRAEVSRHIHMIKDCVATGDAASLRRYAILCKIYTPSK